MDSILESCSQRSKLSQDSFDWSEFDDALDLDQPPTFNATISPLEFNSYSSQLILTRSSQRNKSRIDSGLDVESNSSTFSSQTSHVSFEGQKRIANHSVSPASTPSRSVVRRDVDSGFSLSPIACAVPSKKSRWESPLQTPSLSQTDSLNANTFRSPLKPSTLNRLPNLENRKAAASSQRQTGATYSDESTHIVSPERESDQTNSNDASGHFNDTTVQQQSPPNPNESLSNPIHLKIAPILNLMSQIKTQYSDYAFVYALAAHMCKDIYPGDCHISLKTALLLSIVSCNGQNDEQPISIMAIARDSAVVSSVMGSIGRVAKRFICIGDDVKFNGRCSLTKNIAANSLLLAKNGVYFVGDWLGLKPASITYLQNVFDSGRVSIDTSLNIDCPLNSSMWMYWTCAGKKMSQNEKILSIISKIFGIPVVLDDAPSQAVIDFIFAKYCTDSCDQQVNDDVDDNDGIDESVIRTYLEFVSSIPTVFDTEAFAMLKYYFIVTRATRPNILTPKSFDVLHRLSECHAKLCLRQEVLKIDVIFSIELFEQFVLKTFAGQIVTKPMPNASASSYQQVDENMFEFIQWLEGYLSNVNESVNTFFQEIDP